MEEQSYFNLPDGRRIAYAQFGRSDGKAVFFFHGMPGSRFFRPSDEITSRRGARLICVDRPGYGGSTFQPGRRILDWPGDIDNLADSLGLGKFSVAAHSGGGPFALACAYALPGRVRAAAILSGAGPVETPGATAGMSGVYRFGFTIGRRLPWPLWRMLIWLVYHRRGRDPAAAMDRDGGHRPPADEVQIQRPEVRQACLQSEIEAFRPGLLGLAWEARLLTQPWGFPLEEIHVPVRFWQGSQDDLATVPMARYMSGRIPGSLLTVCDGEAHLLLFPHWDEILGQLLME